MKRVPLRMCAGCRQQKPKPLLHRIVATRQGVYVDATGKAQGRGIYVCRNIGCITKMQRTRKSRIAGGNSVPDAVFEQLKELTQNE